MAKSKRSSKIELPHTLTEAVRNGRAVLVFGAGASMECKDVTGRSPPSGKQLRDHLALKYLGTKNEERDLATVAEMSITGADGLTLVFEEINRLLTGYQPSNRNPPKHEELSHATVRQAAAEKAVHHRDAVRQAQIANGAGTHKAPLPNQRLRSFPVMSHSLHTRQNKGRHERGSMIKALIQNSG